MNKKTQEPQDLDHFGFRLFAAIGRFSIKYRWFVLVFWVVLAGFIVGNLPSLSSVTQNNNENFLPANSPTEKALKLEDAFQPSSVVSIPLVISSNQPLTSTDQNLVSQIQTKVSKVSDVSKVVNRGESSDNEAVLLEIQATNKFNNSNPTGFIQNIRDAVHKVDLPGGVQAHLSGELAEEADSASGSSKQNTELQLGTVIFIILLLLAIFRAPLAPLVTLIPPVIIVSIAGPIIAEAGKHGLKVSSLAQLLLTVLVLGAGTDYGLFLIFRVREELEGGLEPRKAIEKAMSRVGESITFSAATVIVALLSLLLATFQIYSNLGIPLAIGVTLMLIAGLTLLPALLTIFGKGVFWPMKPSQAKSKRIGLWGKVSSRVVNRPVLVLSLGVLAFVILATFVHSYQAGGFGGQSAPSTSDSAKGDAQLAKHFPSNNTNPTEVLFVFNKPIWQNSAPIIKAADELSKSSLLNHVTGPFNPNGVKLPPTQLNSIYGSIGSPWGANKSFVSDSVAINPKLIELYKSDQAYISPDGKTVQFAVGLAAGDPSTTKAMNATPMLRAEVSKIAASVGAKNSSLIGESSAFYDISHISDKDLVHVIPIAVIIIGLLLAILMRSLVAPLYLVASVVLSYLASLGMAVLIFMDLGHESGIVFILPFLMFIFLLALGEDYNILVMTRIREEAHSMPLKKAVATALSTTGTTVTSAGLVLAGTFFVLGAVSGGNQQVQDIGFGLSIGILMDTFLVRTVLVPATVVLLGRYNWWPSKLATTSSDSD
jgi:RND superfamily putative drug exporter